jgi:ABC-type multidrug transport system fused ATPase/permease subunit
VRFFLFPVDRLSTIKDSDKICVFDRGELVQQGTHDELLRDR